MALQDKEFDITRNIKIIEWLKSQLLSDVSQLYASMVKTEADTNDRADLMADMVILTYLLAKRLGVPYTTLDMKIMNKLKVGILENSTMDEWYGELVALSKHLEKSRDLTRR